MDNIFKDGTIAKYMEHMYKLHGKTVEISQFCNQQIRLVSQGVRDIRLGDDAVILLDGLIKGY